jgi:hypothetical protein
MPDIDEILQAQLEAIENGRAVDDVLQALPNEVQDLEPLIKLASAVRTLPHPEFDLEKALATQQRMLAASQAVTRPAARRRPAQGLNLRWLLSPGYAAMAAVFLVVLIVISAAGVWFAGPPGGRSALVTQVNGRVEAAASGSTWRPVYSGERVFSGERIRTYGGSQATLVFFEGSRTEIGANADLSLNRINGRWGQSLQVEIAQDSGKTDHTIVPLQGKNSSYVVHTPGASANVQGTTFSVTVADNGQSRFTVHTGKVQVSNQRSQVSITAGQATLAQPNQILEEPAYTFNISGQMTYISNYTWTVEGVTFNIDENTSISGNPVLGDDLIVSGRIAANNTYIADSIAVALIPQPISTFIGELQHQDADAWQVSNQTVLVNEATTVATDLQIGDPIIVTFSVLNDGSRLARSIATMDAAAEILPNSATPSPVPGAKPVLEFTSDEVELNTCSTEIILDGSLTNLGETENDFAANVRLGWLIEKGAEYIDEMELSATSTWDRIDAGVEVPFSLQVTLKEAWGSEENAQVILRVIITQETNRPDHLKAKMTFVVKPCEGAEPEPEPTPTEEPAPTETPADLPVTPPVFKSPFCDLENTVHPTGKRLSERYDVPYIEIMYWFCQGFGFGEIDLAFNLLRTYEENYTDLTIEKIFEMKEPGTSWGQIKQEFEQKSVPGVTPVPPGQQKNPPGLQKTPPGLEKKPPGLEKKPDKDRSPQVVPTRKPSKP